ncbi:hypothetical protein VYU27_002714 [Nannochloropsis oceanica]
MARIPCRRLDCFLLLLLAVTPYTTPAAVAVASIPTPSSLPVLQSPLKKGRQEPPATPSRSTWDIKTFHAFVKARTGGMCAALAGPASSTSSPTVYWVLRGQLSNPFTGDVIANVRGLEVLYLLGYTQAPDIPKISKYQTLAIAPLPPSVSHALPGTRKCLHLPEPQADNSNKAKAETKANASSSVSKKQPWCAVATTISAKTFRYFEPLTNQPLLTFRPGPRAKPRQVPLAVTTTQAVSYVLSRSGHLHLVAESVTGGLMAVQDQGAGPVCKAKRSKLLSLFFPMPAPKTFELSLLMWPGSKRSNHGMSSGSSGSNGVEDGGGGGGGFPWGSIIQFGASSAQPACRELYALSTEPASKQQGRRPRMKYLRYGEAPHWCGAGRVCHLALKGTRYDRLQDIPREERQLFFPNTKKGLEGEEGGSLLAVFPPGSAQEFLDEAERVRRTQRKRFIFF